MVRNFGRDLRDGTREILQVAYPPVGCIDLSFIEDVGGNGVGSQFLEFEQRISLCDHNVLGGFATIEVRSRRMGDNLKACRTLNVLIPVREATNRMDKGPFQSLKKLKKLSAMRQVKIRMTKRVCFRSSMNLMAMTIRMASLIPRA